MTLLEGSSHLNESSRPSSQPWVTPAFRMDLNIPGMDTVGLDRTDTRNGPVVSNSDVSACDRS